jgi:hypothetical protein
MSIEHTQRELACIREGDLAKLVDDPGRVAPGDSASAVSMADGAPLKSHSPVSPLHLPGLLPALQRRRIMINYYP